MRPTGVCWFIQIVAATDEGFPGLLMRGRPAHRSQAQLLRQHHVANRKPPFRPKAIRNRSHAAFVQLVHIHLVSGPDAITLAAVPASQFEIDMFFKLCELGWR